MKLKDFLQDEGLVRLGKGLGKNLSCEAFVGWQILSPAYLTGTPKSDAKGDKG